MKRNLKVLVLIALFAAASCSFTTKSFDNPDKDKLLVDLITYVLDRYHYDAKEVNDDFSEQVFEEFIAALDPAKRYFLESDIKEFAKYKDQIDEQIANKEITFFDMAHERMLQRIADAQEIYQEVLREPFDLDQEEELNTDYEELDFVKNKRELKERWRKQLKLSTLATLYDKVEEQNKKLEEGEEVEEKSLAELEEEAREITKDAMEEYFEFTEDLQRKDYFSVYINAIVMEFDPHSYYLAPLDKDRFDLQISGQFEGIGARLQKKSGEIHVTEIISGGPAWRGEELEEGDIILKVAQEDETMATPIVGMRLEDAIKLIKGPKGTKVTLNVKKKIDGSVENIVITRDVVELEETYAKTAVLDKEDRKFGVINLPKFYFDMQDYKERNAASDVRDEIIRLKEQGVEGLVLDLRNNGGGSLKTVVDIAGLFIKEGPVVQVRSNGEDGQVLSDRDDSILWDGPLVILVNEISASASEILAAAMQDYERAIIIGSKQTYGKGTVQNVVDLNMAARNTDFGDMGALKITTQKFYRINGGSTQLEGVKSDVVVPDRYSYVDVGERDLNDPLPWDKIAKADYKKWDGYIDFKENIANSKARMAQNSQLQLIDEYAQWIRKKRDESIWPLSWSGYKARLEKNDAEAERFKALEDYNSSLTFKSLSHEEALFANDTILKEKRERWHEDLAQDVYIEEAINVLEDMKLNNIRRRELAAVKD
ncbi:carboxy terminal-processing peptidase [Croceiramulus getboli]|nr:carboxy terminal-processing peptidase [Flavobacteriaceae bacterium YJPT1-3]